MMLAPVREASTPPETVETELTTRSMGGTLRLLVASTPSAGDRVERDLRRVAGRIDAWARRLTRFSDTSDLSTLNADPHAEVTAVRPTIGAVLSHAQRMTATTDGTVDVTMLDARLAAELGDRPAQRGDSSWRLSGSGRHLDLVRSGPSRLDLDGVAKGWIADRALRLLGAYPSALVDADGDVAVRASWSTGWCVAVEHPHDDAIELARLCVPLDWPSSSYGIATSGTSVHRWAGHGSSTHHLIEPLTHRSAVTDVVQATVVAESAGVAECLAKSAVIRGSQGGLELLDRAGAWAAVLLLEDDELFATPGTSGWLA